MSTIIEPTQGIANPMSHDSEALAEMYALWEQYSKLRSIGGKRFRKQMIQSRSTFVECFNKQTPEVRTAFIEEALATISDYIVNAPDDFWIPGAGLYMLKLPQHIEDMLYAGAISTELFRLYRENPNDVQIIRLLVLIERMGDEKELYAIHKDQMILRRIVVTYLSYLSYDCHEIPTGILNTPEIMNQNVAEARNYLNQLEPSTLKDKWNEQLLEYERFAKCWEDYCTHKWFYIDFRHYLTMKEVEW